MKPILLIGTLLLMPLTPAAEGQDASSAQGTVKAVRGSLVVIDLGAKTGITKGADLSVVRMDEIKDSKGQVVWSGKHEVGTLKVVEVQEQTTLATITSGTDVKEGDLVIASPRPVQAPPPQLTEVKQLVAETKGYAQTELGSLPAGPAGGSDQIPQVPSLSHLPGLLDQLQRSMEASTQAAQQGGDVSKSDARTLAILAALEALQRTLPDSPSGEKTPPAAGQEGSPLENISANLAKIILIAQQAQQLRAALRKGPGGGPPDIGTSGTTTPESAAGDPTASEATEGSQAKIETEGSQTKDSPTDSPPTTESPQAGPAAPPAPTGGGPFAPAEAGYASVSLEGWPSNNRLRVKVNGLQVGAYDRHVSISVDPFLKPGVVNIVVLTFTSPKGEVYLSAKVPGSDQWTRILQFAASQDILEDTFEVPFVGEGGQQAREAGGKSEPAIPARPSPQKILPPRKSR